MSNGESTTKVVTGKCRLSYVHVWQPHAMQDGQEPKYSVSVIIPKSNTKLIAKIKEAIKNAKEAGISKFGGKIPPNLKLPLRDGDLDRPDDETYANSYFINCTCKTKPGVVDRELNPILDQNELYSGCYGMVSMNMYAFNASGNKGIAAGLNNIMKVADGEPLSGRVSAEADFADIEIEDEFDDELLR